MLVVEDFVHGFVDQRAKLDRARLRRLVELASSTGTGFAGLTHRYPEVSLQGLGADVGNAASAGPALGWVHAVKVLRDLESPYSEEDRARVPRRLGRCTRPVDLKPTWTLGAKD